MMMDKFDLLSRCIDPSRIQHKKMSHKLRQEVTKRVIVKKFARGSTVAKQGDASDTLFFISKGVLDIVQDGVLLTTMGTGEIVGERALLEPGSVLHADIVAAVARCQNVAIAVRFAGLQSNAH